MDRLNLRLEDRHGSPARNGKGMDAHAHWSTMNFYGQYREDQWLVENLKLPERGIFVEVGASDGRECSNTLHFEEKGWTGLCVEADPRVWNALLANRKCACYLGAVAPKPGRVNIDCTVVQTHSGIGRNATTPYGKGTAVSVPALSLSALLTAHDIEHVDILSIDTEGTEIDVWDSIFDWVLWDGRGHPLPSIVIMEWETAGLPSAEAALMTRMTPTYKCVHKTAGNLIFQRAY